MNFSQMSLLVQTLKEREVWIVSNFPPPAHGVSLFNEMLVQNLRQKGVSVRVFRVGTKNTIKSIERFEITKTLNDCWTLIRFIGAALAIPKKKRQDIVVYFTPSQMGAAVFRDFLVGKLAKFFFSQTVAHLHGCRWLDTWGEGKNLQGQVMYKALKDTSAVICLGPSYAAKMKEFTGLRTVGIQNGISIQEKPLCKTSPVRDESIRCFFLSTLMRAKGLWETASAIRLMRAKGINATLYCAGSWYKTEEKLQFENDFAAEIRSGQIVFLGFLSGEAKVKEFKLAHFFFLPTLNRFEGQPLSLIEAMSFGVLPITTSYGGIPDLFYFKGAELLCSSLHISPEGMVQNIEKILSHPRRFEELSSLCLEHCRKELTEERCVSQVMDTFFEHRTRPTAAVNQTIGER